MNSLMGRTSLVGLVLISFTFSAHAHVVPRELSDYIDNSKTLHFLSLGYKHIIPLGYDHILFIVSLFLLHPRLKPLLWQTSAFTIAHCITLLLAAGHVLLISVPVIEILIALSILWVALENIYSTELRAIRIGLIFIFGLIHGLGFAENLNKIGFQGAGFLKGLLMFNLGIEIGQLSIILLLYVFLIRWWGDKPGYRKYVVIPISSVIALIATWLVIVRVL